MTSAVIIPHHTFRRVAALHIFHRVAGRGTRTDPGHVFDRTTTGYYYDGYEVANDLVSQTRPLRTDHKVACQILPI
jgi:hypothetical protein